MNPTVVFIHCVGFRCGCVAVVKNVMNLLLVVVFSSILSNRKCDEPDGCFYSLYAFLGVFRRPPGRGKMTVSVVTVWIYGTKSGLAVLCLCGHWFCGLTCGGLYV